MQATSLPLLPAGRRARITDIEGSAGFIGRATAIGFTPGAELTLIRNSKGWPLIVFLRDTQIVVDREESQGILVHEINNIR
jgi:ferrous iron transport protein A